MFIWTETNTDTDRQTDFGAGATILVQAWLTLVAVVLVNNWHHRQSILPSSKSQFFCCWLAGWLAGCWLCSDSTSGHHNLLDWCTSSSLVHHHVQRSSWHRRRSNILPDIVLLCSTTNRCVWRPGVVKFTIPFKALSCGSLLDPYYYYCSSWSIIIMIIITQNTYSCSSPPQLLRSLTFPLFSISQQDLLSSIWTMSGMQRMPSAL